MFRGLRKRCRRGSICARIKLHAGLPLHVLECTAKGGDGKVHNASPHCVGVGGTDGIFPPWCIDLRRSLPRTGPPNIGARARPIHCQWNAQRPAFSGQRAVIPLNRTMLFFGNMLRVFPAPKRVDHTAWSRAGGRMTARQLNIERSTRCTISSRRFAREVDPDVNCLLLARHRSTHRPGICISSPAAAAFSVECVPITNRKTTKPEKNARAAFSAHGSAANRSPHAQSPFTLFIAAHHGRRACPMRDAKFKKP